MQAHVWWSRAGELDAASSLLLRKGAQRPSARKPMWGNERCSAKVVHRLKFNQTYQQDLLVLSENKKTKESGKGKGIPGINLSLACPNIMKVLHNPLWAAGSIWWHSSVISSSVIELAYSLMENPVKQKHFPGAGCYFSCQWCDCCFFGQYFLRLRGEKKPSSHLAHVEDKKKEKSVTIATAVNVKHAQFSSPLSASYLGDCPGHRPDRNSAG